SSAACQSPGPESARRRHGTGAGQVISTRGAPQPATTRAADASQPPSAGTVSAKPPAAAGSPEPPIGPGAAGPTAIRGPSARTWRPTAGPAPAPTVGGAVSTAGIGRPCPVPRPGQPPYHLDRAYSIGISR